MGSYGKWYLINGVKQYIHIISENSENPLLLYLHGGPGDAALPLIEHFNVDLAKRYTVIIWEQRGAGKSYYPFKPNEEITIDSFVSDLKVLTKRLLNEWKQEKICLMGHSWGSIIGMKFIQRYPEMVAYYIGVGQVISGQKMFAESRRYILEHSTSPVVNQRIASIDTTFQQDDWYNELMYFMKQLIKAEGSIYKKKSYLELYPFFIRSKHYSLRDCIKRIQGSKQAIERLWQEVARVDFTNCTELDVPIILIEGEQDYHVSKDVAFNFYQRLTSPKRFICMKKAAHFPQWTRAAAFNQVVNSLGIPQAGTGIYLEC
ncbi:MAG: alpha/beta fold hydrolase [Enterococcus sp.]